MADGGVWRTVGGRRVFIKDGEDLQTAMKNSGKFKNLKNEVADEKMQFDKSLEEYEMYLGEKIEELNDVVKNKWLTMGANGDLYSKAVKIENELTRKNLTNEETANLNKEYAQVMFSLKKRKKIRIDDEIKFPNSNKVRY